MQVNVADGLLLRDLEVHTICNAGPLLVVLLQVLLFDVSHLSLSSVLLICLGYCTPGLWGVLLLLVLLGNCGV